MKYNLLISLMILPLVSLAGDNLSLHGTLVAPPCTINNGQSIEVLFGDNLGINKVDGNNYRQQVNYSVDCDAEYSANNLAIVVDTTSPAAFDSAGVQTNKTGLGIHILVDGVAATFAERVVLSDPSAPPKIEAVPVKDPGVTLTEGAFEAARTLRTDYL
ncbi:TPA: fimbrial protein [Enterobacter asburiae]|nr:fimbrial protein [Enterobacter asburiae]